MTPDGLQALDNIAFWLRLVALAWLAVAFLVGVGLGVFIHAQRETARHVNAGAYFASGVLKVVTDFFQKGGASNARPSGGADGMRKDNSHSGPTAQS